MKTKFQWSIRTGSAFPILGFVFGLLALAFSVISVKLTGYLDFRVPYFLFNTGKQIANFISVVVPAASATVLLIACLCHCFGLGKKATVASTVMLLLSTLCRFGVELYTALYIDRVPFYPFQLAYLDILLTLLLLVAVVLTCCRVLRTNLPVIIAGLTFGIAITVLTVLRVGGYGSAQAINFSGMIFYLCSCIAISLCFMAWTGKNQPVSAAEPAPDGQSSSDPVENALSPLESLSTQAPSEVVSSSIPPEQPATTEDPAAPTVSESSPSPATMDAEKPAETAPQSPASALHGMPIPMEGHIWRQIGHDPDGTPVYMQQQIFTDVKTGRQTPGPFVPIYYPHPPVQSVQSALQQPTPQPAPQTANPVNQADSLLRQLATLHEQGILSDEEYAAKCKQVLSHL